MSDTYCALCTHETQPPSLICTRCEDTLKKWLHEIPDRYTQLDTEIGAVDTGETNTSPRVDSAAPMRLDVLDLLDERHGRHWAGLTPAVDRRGVVGTLHAHADRVRDERHLPPGIEPPTVLGEAKLLQRHLLWIAEQDWIDDFHDELKTLHTQLGYAIGDVRPKPVGRCVVDRGDGVCDGPLFPMADDAGVRCARCSDTWGNDELRRLGLLLGESS